MTATAVPVIHLHRGECRWPIRQWDPRVQVKVSSEDSAGALTVCELLVPPRSGPPLHLHRYESEWFLVLEGSLRFNIEGKHYRAEAGDSLFVPQRTAHTFANTGAEPARLLTIFTPGGLDHYFASYAAMNPPDAPPDPSTQVRLYDKYNMVFLAPPGELGPTTEVRIPARQKTGHLTLLTTLEESRTALSAVTLQLAPRSSFTLPELHSSHLFVYTMNGNALLLPGGDPLEPGDSIYLSSGTPLGFSNPFAQPAKIVIASLPAGIEQYLPQAINPFTA